MAPALSALLACAAALPARPASAAQAVFDPAPVRPWLPAFDGLAGALPLPSLPEALAPLVRELPGGKEGRRLRAELLDFGSLPEARKRRALETLDAARLAAAPRAERAALSLAARLSRRKLAGEPGSAALRRRVGELDAAAALLGSLESSRLYGESAGLAAARRELGEAAAAARSAWLGERLEEEAAKLKGFLDALDAEVIAKRPDLFAVKLRKAAASDAAFYRAFPQLQFDDLRSGPHAARIAATPRLRLAGDGHPENIELLEDGRRLIPQVNDFDDSALGPAGLDLVRSLAGAGLLASERGRSAVLAEAAEAYRRSLGMAFKAWAKEVDAEDSVSKAEAKDMDWHRRAGKRLDDKALEARLARLEGIDARNWEFFDRAGAGLSSIGVRRYMFASKKRAHAHEIKELRPPATRFFTGEKDGEGELARTAAAYRELRQVPADARVAEHGGAAWLLRRREGRRSQLDFSRPRSSARAIGGLLAQLHRAQVADAAPLRRAMSAPLLRAAAESARFMARMRQVLLHLLEEGAWDLPPAD